MQVVKALECTSLAIKTDVPLQLWDATTSSSSSDLPIWAIRVLHNKPRYYFTNYSQCYFHYLSPKFFINQVGLTKLAFFAIITIVVLKKYPMLKKPAILLILVYPLFMIFELYRNFL